ncbi:hypothetical protein [Conchiformibius steedae]|uniref:hypothetical protein n=1 Tax=Conchiformibius steedae TaxID=153493 RepID=UPI0026E95EA3|nr:hypothetical protein [Conchiformibius steedae]
MNALKKLFAKGRAMKAKLTYALVLMMMSSPTFAADVKSLVNSGLEALGWLVWIAVAVAVAVGAWFSFFAVVDLKNMFNPKYQGPKANGVYVVTSLAAGIVCLCFGGYLGWAKANFETNTNSIGVGVTIDSDSFKLK